MQCAVTYYMMTDQVHLLLHNILDWLGTGIFQRFLTLATQFLYWFIFSVSLPVLITPEEGSQVAAETFG